MATKDPHIALLDAHERIQAIQLRVKAEIDRVKGRAQRGELDADEKAALAKFVRRMVDETRRVQDELAEELTSHGL
jgi:molecular chaperone GrpE (heat shock protein)